MLHSFSILEIIGILLLFKSFCKQSIDISNSSYIYHCISSFLKLDSSLLSNNHPGTKNLIFIFNIKLLRVEKTVLYPSIADIIQ